MNPDSASADRTTTLNQTLQLTQRSLSKTPPSAKP